MSKHSSHIDTISRLREQLKAKEDENKKLNDELDKYIFAINGVNEGIWDINTTTEEYFVTTPWLTMLGYSEDDSPPIKGLWESHLHPDDKHEAITNFKKLLNGQIKNYNAVFRLRHNNGEYIWVRSKASPFYDEKGRMIRVSGTHRDITEQMNSRNALIESEKKYKGLFQNSLVAIFRSNAKTGEILDCNKKFLSLLGVSSHHNIFTGDYYPNPKDRDDLVKTLKSKGIVHSKEIRVKRANGNIIWVLFSAILYPHDGVIEAILFDISELIQTRKELVEKENLYRTLFENSVMGIVRERISTSEILQANNKFWEIMGDEKRTTNKAIDFYLHKKDRKMLIDSRKGDRIENIELQVRRVSDKKIIWLLLSSKIRTEQDIAETICVDITKKKEDKIELEKVNFELDRFVYHSSHDLRSPLRSILGLINLFRGEEDNFLRNEYVERIEKSVQKLDNLVQDLLCISRNDRINDIHQEINFLQEINNSLEGFFHAHNTEKLSVETYVVQPQNFSSDLTRIRIILNNLISNAIKYRNTNIRESTVRVEVIVNAQKAVITVYDNGEGIPKDQIPLIFDMFYRASQQSEGSGLGLYIVKSVLDKLEGNIEVKSIFGKETTFTITIPNSPENEKEKENVNTPI